MTRAFMATARGDLSQAFTEHLFSPILFLGFCGLTVHTALELSTKRQITAFYSQLLSNSKLQLFILLAIGIYHGFRLYNLSISGELLRNFIDSPLGQLISAPHYQI